jgi:hypothetical protein
MKQSAADLDRLTHELEEAATRPNGTLAQADPLAPLNPSSPIKPIKPH